MNDTGAGLPDADERLGKIRWSGWEDNLRILCSGSRRRGGVDLRDDSCAACRFEGPLTNCWGDTCGADRRLLRTHWAVRCPHCGETRVYLTPSGSPDGEFTELTRHHIGPAVEKTPPPAGDDVLF